MGTRADFYLGRGETAEWIGSIAWDAYPDGIPASVLSASTQEQFTTALLVFVSDRDDFTSPEDGWPWPWKDSRTTDYAYAFDEGEVWASHFGQEWFRAVDEELHRDEPKTAIFPDMTKHQAVTHGKRSGVIVVGG